MDKKIARKAVGIAGMAVLCINLALFSFRVYPDIVFWIVLGVTAAACYIALHFLK